MKLPHRRQFLHLAAGAAALPAVSRIARAQAYPTRPVRWIVGFPAAVRTTSCASHGSMAVRAVWPAIHHREPARCRHQYRHRGGREGTPRRLYAVSIGPRERAVNASLYEKLNFNFIRDIAPVAGIFRAPLVMEVNPSVPAKTVPEFIAYAKANPGKINMASPGNGSAPHMAGELFKMVAGVNIIHVPYRGEGSALTDLLGGQVQLMFPAPAATVEYVRAGKLRALAVTSSTRWEGLPDIPTMADFVPGYEASVWFGVGAPANTPNEIIDKLNKEINAALADPKIKARLAGLGGVTLRLSPAEFGKLIADETENWGKVIRAANIKLD